MSLNERNLAYSALTCLQMGMSGSTSFPEGWESLVGLCAASRSPVNALNLFRTRILTHTRFLMGCTISSDLFSQKERRFSEELTSTGPFDQSFRFRVLHERLIVSQENSHERESSSHPSIGRRR
jgi:hypothetical protein